MSAEDDNNGEITRVMERMIASGIDLPNAMRVFRRAYLLEALRSFRANQVRTARFLGVHRITLSRLIEDSDISATDLARLRAKAAAR
jgi:DNA-binding NtrC family response regulator